MKAAPMATVPSAKAVLRQGTWLRREPLSLLCIEEEVGLLLELELLVDEFDAVDTVCDAKKKD
jgi:hypothetical protein